MNEMEKAMPIQFNSNIAAAPLYVGGASIEDIRRQHNIEAIVKLASNESPLGPSPRATEAMQQAITGLNRYPPMGDETLRAALARLNGAELQPDNFVTGNGGCDILNMIATAFLTNDSECVICRPTFPVYDITARRTGANVVYADLDRNTFNYDVEAILAAVTAKTRVVYVCSPNNPTGTTLSPGQMEALVSHLPEHVLLVADEVYHHFATTSNPPNTLDYVQQNKNVVILHSFSKAYGLAGLRLGYAIAPVEIAQYLSRARLPFHLDNITIEGALAAVADQEHLSRGVDLVTTGRQWLQDHLTRMGITTWSSQANFILFQPPFDAAEVSERLLRRGLIVRPMGQFYLPAHLRVTIGLPEENERFINALNEVLSELQAENHPRQRTENEKDGQEFKF
jgi:histidinol-phosphate aminotransferase